MRATAVGVALLARVGAVPPRAARAVGRGLDAARGLARDRVAVGGLERARAPRRRARARVRRSGASTRRSRCSSSSCSARSCPARPRSPRTGSGACSRCSRVGTLVGAPARGARATASTPRWSRPGCGATRWRGSSARRRSRACARAWATTASTRSRGLGHAAAAHRVRGRGGRARVGRAARARSRSPCAGRCGSTRRGGVAARALVAIVRRRVPAAARRGAARLALLYFRAPGARRRAARAAPRLDARALRARVRARAPDRARARARRSRRGRARLLDARARCSTGAERACRDPAETGILRRGSNSRVSTLMREVALSAYESLALAVLRWAGVPAARCLASVRVRARRSSGTVARRLAPPRTRLVVAALGAHDAGARPARGRARHRAARDQRRGAVLLRLAPACRLPAARAAGARTGRWASSSCRSPRCSPLVSAAFMAPPARGQRAVPEPAVRAPHGEPVPRLLGALGRVLRRRHVPAPVRRDRAQEGRAHVRAPALARRPRSPRPPHGRARLRAAHRGHRGRHGVGAPRVGRRLGVGVEERVDAAVVGRLPRRTS